MALTDTVIRTAKPKMVDGCPVIDRITDEKGMYLFITIKCQKYFRLDYRIGDTRKCLFLGVYPETALKEARERRDEARNKPQPLLLHV